MIVLFVGVVAVVAARLPADGVLRDVEAIRDGLIAVGAGERDVRISTGGNDELGELALAANAMIAKLQAEEAARDQSDSARRDLVAAVSHDLRTPITSLRLLADAVSDDIVDGEMRRTYLQRMRTHIEALSSLIDDLFELSRLEAGDIGWSLERVPLAELVGETVEAMRVQADPRGVAVSAEVPRGAQPRAGQSGEAPARALQPDPERDPSHPRRRQHRRPRRARRRPARDRGRGHRRRDRAARSASACSPPSTAAAAMPRAATAARALGSRSRARSWRPTAAASGSPTRAVGTRVRFSLPVAA